MEPEDLPWPGELEEEEEEGEEEAEVESQAAEEPRDSEETVNVEEGAGPASDSVFQDEFRVLASTDDEEDDEAKAWLQAHPGSAVQLPPPPRHLYAADRRPSPEKRTESWHCLPQERDSFQTVDTSQSRIIARVEVTEVTDFPSLEEDKLTQSDQVKELNSDLLCSSLLVIQDDFASPALPLLTCLTQDQEFGPDSLFHQSELDFAPLRGIPDKSEDSEWFSRPSEVSEALFQATSEASSDLVNSCFSISQHLLTEGLQGKAESDVITLDGDTEYSSLDENAAVCSERVTESQRQTFGQCDLTGEYIELADIETLLDDLCDSSLYWQPTSQLLSEEDSNFGKPCNNLGSNQPFSSTLPPCIPHEPSSESECHSSNLRMLRVSTDTLSKSLEHLEGDTCNGDIVETIQSKLKSSIIGDSDIETHSSLSIEDLPHLDVSFPKESTVGLHTDNVNQKALADSHLTKESLKVSNITEPSDQNLGTSTIIFTSYSQRKKSNILYQEGLPDGNKIDQAKTVSVVSEPSDQKSDIPILTSASYSRREKPDIFYWQDLSGSHLPEEALQISGYSDPEAQKTGAPRASVASYSQPQTPIVYYPQTLLYGPLPEHTLKPSDDFEPVEQKTGLPVAPSALYSQKQRPRIYLQQPLAGGPLPEPADRRTVIPTASVASYSQRQRPSVYYPEILSGGLLPEEGLKGSNEPVYQKIVTPTASTASYSQRQRPSVSFQQPLTGGPLPEETLKVSDEPVYQSTVTPTASTASYSQRQRPSVSFQQPLTGGPLPEETLKVSDEPVYWRTVTPTASTASYSQRQRPSVSFQQPLTGGPLPEETLKVSDEPVYWRTVTPTASTASYSQRQRPSVSFQQPLTGGPLPEETLKVSDKPVYQSTVTPTASTASYSQRQRPSVSFQQPLTGGPLPEETLKVSDEPVYWRTVTPTASTASYSQRQRPSVYSPQALSGGALPEETLKVSDEPVYQSTVTPTASIASYSQRQRPSVSFQQPLTGGPLPEETLKVSDKPVYWRTVTPTASIASYSQRQRPSVYSPQALSGGALPEETLKVSDEPIDYKTGALSASYSQRQRPSVYYPQILVGGPLPEEVLKASHDSEPVDQKTVTPTASTASYSQRQRPSVYYPQILVGGPLPEEVLKASHDSEPVDQKTVTPTASTASYSQRQRSSAYYPQILVGGPLPEEVLKVSDDSEPVDQKTVTPTASTASYSQRQRSSVYYPQIVVGGPLPEEVLKVSDDSEPVDQKTVIPTASIASYSQRQRPSVYYKQILVGGPLPEEVLKVSDDSEPVDQKTVTPTASTASYSQRQRPSVYYPQILVGGPLPEEVLKVSDDSEPVDQKTVIPTASTASYSQRQRPSVYYPQILVGGPLPEEVLKVSDDSEPVDQKTVTPTASTASYSRRQRPSVYYPQILVGGPLPEEVLKVSDDSEPVDQKTVTPTASTASYSQRQRPSVYYKQILVGGPLPEEVLKAADDFESVDQKTVTPTASTASYSRRQRPSVYYQPSLPGGLLPEEALKALDKPVDQKTVTPTTSGASYSQRQRPSVHYPQPLPGGPLPEGALKESDDSEPVDQKTVTPTASYSQRQRPSAYYSQTLPGSFLLEEALKAVDEPVDQKAMTPNAFSGSFSQRQSTNVYYPQALPGSLLEDALKALYEPVEQKTMTPQASAASYLQRPMPNVSYSQVLQSASLPEEVLTAEPAGQRTVTPTTPAASYSQRQSPSAYYQQALSGGALPEEALKVSDEPVEQRTGTPRASSASISQRQRPSVHYPQILPGGPLPEGLLKTSDGYGPTDLQKTVTPTASAASSSQRQRPSVYTSQALPGSLPLEEVLKVSDEPTDQKTMIPTASAASYVQKQKPGVYSPQALPAGPKPKEDLKVSDEPIGQKTGAPTVPSASYSQRQRTSAYYPLALAGGPPPEEALKTLDDYDLVEQKTVTPTMPAVSYFQRQRPNVYYPEALAGSPLLDKGLNVSNEYELDSLTGTVRLSSASYSQRQKPSIYSQPALSGGPVSQEALKISNDHDLVDQKTAAPTSSSTSSQSQRPSVYYQQALPDGPLPEKALKVSDEPINQKTETERISSVSHSQRRPTISFQDAFSGDAISQEPWKVSDDYEPVELNTGIPTVSTALYSQRQRSSVHYQPALPSGLPEEALIVSDGSLDQTIGTPAAFSPSYLQSQRTSTSSSTSSFQRQRPGVYYQQPLPYGPLPEDALKVSADSEPLDQKSGTPRVSSASSSQRQIPNIYYQPAFPSSQLLEESLKASASPEPADQKTGTSAILSSSYPPGKGPITFYHQALPSSHLPEESPKVSASALSADQKTGMPTTSSHSYPFVEKSIIFYQNDFPSSPLTTETLNVLALSGPPEQKTSPTSEPSCSYSVGEKAIIFYQQALPDVQLTNESLKVSVIPGPIAQKTGIPTVNSSSYPDVEKAIVSYQQVLPDSHLTENTVNVSVVPGPTDQKAEIPTVSSTSYSQREKSSVSYQQEVPDFSEKALKVVGVLGPAEQKSGIQTAPSVSYTREEKPIITYQQELPGLTEVALKTVGVVPGPTDQKARIQIVSPSSYSGFPQQELPDINEEALGVFVPPQPVVQKVGTPTEPLSYYSQREESAFSQQESPVIHLTDEAQKVSAASVLAAQTTGTQTESSTSYFPTEKLSDFHPQTLPDNNLTEESLKALAVPGVSDQNRRPIVPPSSYPYEEKLKISTANLPDIQKTELLTTTHSTYSQREKPTTSTELGPDDQKTPSPTVFHGSYPKRVTPGTYLQQQLPSRDQSEDILKISTVPQPTDKSTGIPVLLSGSNSPREKYDPFYPQELTDRHLTEGVLKVTIIPEPADKETVLVTALPSSFSHRGKQSISYQNDLADRHLSKDVLKVSSGLGQTDQIAGLPTVSPGAYSHDEKHKLVSEHVQRLMDDLSSPDSCVSSNSMPLNSQVDDADIINKPESSVFGEAGCEDIRDTDHSSKTLKEIRTLLMEAENIALKRCNFPAPLVPFRDVNDVPCVQSKKVVCFKEPSTSDVSHDIHQRELIIEESPRIDCIQKDIGTQTNLKCQQGIENWEFFSSTTIRSPLPEAGSTARTAFDETFRQNQAIMRSEPEGCSSTIGNKIIIPMMTIIKSDSSSDVSDGCCSWDSNLPETLESVSDVLLNFFPHTPLKTSIADSREEEGLSENEDGWGSIDSLATHVKYLLQCESSLNHARQILKNAEEEECRVRARAWNLKFNLGHECGYSISELNEDDRRKVEEIKAKLYGHGKATHMPEGLQSPWGMGCKPEAVCSHIIIESHEKGCFRTLNVEQPQLDSHSCVFKSADPSEVIQGRQSPSSWRARHNFSKSLDQNSHHFKVGNSLQLQSHPPFQQLTPDDFKVSKDVEMPPFHANTNTDSWLSELTEPTGVPPKEMDLPSTSQTPPPESMKQFTTSITFSSHRHSKCISDTSFFKVGVTEGSQCTGTSVGVFNSHVTEEQNSPRDFKQKTFSPPSLKRHSHIPGKEVAVLAQSSKQNPKLPAGFEHSHQEEKLLERSNLKGSHSEPITSTNYSNSKGVQFSDNHTLISIGQPSSTLEVKEKNVIITPDLPSCIFLEQRELFEQSQAPHTDHHVRKHHSPPCPDIPSCIFLGQQQLIEQSKAPHLDHEMREGHSFFSQCQDNIILDLPSPIFLEEHQCRSPDVDDHMTKQHVPLSQGQDCIVEKIEHTTKSHICNVINAEAELSNAVSQSPPNHCTLVTSELCTPPSNRKALSCVRITLSPKTPSKLDSGILNERFHSLDPASKTRINSEFNSDLQTISSRSLEPASKLLTSKPIAQNTESLDFLGPKSLLDLQVIQSPLPDSKTITQDLKTIPTQDSQIVTSKQTQVNISDLEGYSKPEGTSVSADGSPEQSNIPFSASSGKLSSDAVTQITTVSPEKTMFLSEIFINTDDSGHEIVDLSTQKTHKVPVKFSSSSSVQQVTTSRGPDAQPVLLPYKPSGSTKMYYVPQLEAIPSFPDSKSDTTVESSHSGSNDAIAPDFPAQVLGTRNDDLPGTVNIKHKEGIYSKRAVTKAPLSVKKTILQKDGSGASGPTGGENLSDNKQKKKFSQRTVTKTTVPEVTESLKKDNEGSSGAIAIQVQDRMTESLPGTKTMKQKEIHNKKTIPKEVCPEEKEALDLDLSESECQSEFENTTHSVFRSAKFYFHHPVHPPNDQDFCHESLGRSVFMRHSWKDFFHHHSDTHREHICLSPPYPLVDKSMMDYTRIKSLSINVNVEDNKMMHTTKSQARDPKSKRQINDSKMDQKVTPEVTTQHTVSLNELWNKYQERQKQQKPSDVCDRKELSLVERLDRLAKLLQNPITHSLQASEKDNSRGRQNVKGWSYGKQQKSKVQKRCKSLERGHTGDFRKGKMLSHQPGRSNQIKIEQIKFDKYILSKQPNFNYISNTSSDSRPSEESDLLTDSPTYVLSSTTSPVDSDILTQTDKDMTLHERSSSISTIDTARLIQAFGHERLCLSPRRIKLYTSITNQQKRYLEKRCKHNKKLLSTGHPQMTSEHTRRRHIQVANSMISDSVSSSSSVLSLNSTLYNEQNVHMLNKGVQAGNLEIVTGAKKHTWDVGVTFPTPSSSEARLEEDSDMTSWSEEIVEEKMLLNNNLGDKKLRKNKNSCEGVSWFVPVGNMKSGSQKENLPKSYGPGVSWFESVTKTKPWREPLREQNLQGQRLDCQETLGGGDDGQGPLRPFVRVTLQEALQLHRPDFISRSGERIKRLKLIVKERKLQNMFQSERNTLFNNAQHPLSRRVFLAAQKNKPIGKKEMIQRSKRIYEQLPEVKKKREEEKRKSEYKTYRLRAQLYKTKVTNQLLGRKVPWD